MWNPFSTGFKPRTNKNQDPAWSQQGEIIKNNSTPNNVEFLRKRSTFNNLFNPVNLHNKPNSNLSPKDENFIKRIWVTVKQITDDEIYLDAIHKYKIILRLNPDPKKLTNDDLRMFIPKKPKTNTQKVRNLFVKESVNNLNAKRFGNNNPNKRTLRNYMKQTISAEQLREYQLNAYNELIALMLVLMEKAFDKFTNNTIYKRSKSKIMGFFKKDDNAGTLKINDVSLDYVKDILGYNINKNINDVKSLIGSSQGSTNVVKGITTGLSSLTLIVLNHIFIYGHAISYCPSSVNTPLTIGTILSKNTGKYICKYVKGQEQLATQVANLVPLINNIIQLGVVGAETIATISLLQGAPIAIYIGFTMYSIYKHEEKNTRLKKIFVDIFDTLFDSSNTIKFNDVKDELFIYNTLSIGEKDLLNKYPALHMTNNTPSRPGFFQSHAKLNNSVNNDLMATYIDGFIKERMRYRADLYAVKLAEENRNKIDTTNKNETDIVYAIYGGKQEKNTNKLIQEFGIINNRALNIPVQMPVKPIQSNFDPFAETIRISPQKINTNNIFATPTSLNKFTDINTNPFNQFD